MRRTNPFRLLRARRVRIAEQERYIRHLEQELQRLKAALKENNR